MHAISVESTEAGSFSVVVKELKILVETGNQYRELLATWIGHWQEGNIVRVSIVEYSSGLAVSYPHTKDRIPR